MSSEWVKSNTMEWAVDFFSGSQSRYREIPRHLETEEETMFSDNGVVAQGTAYFDDYLDAVKYTYSADGEELLSRFELSKIPAISARLNFRKVGVSGGNIKLILLGIPEKDFVVGVITVAKCWYYATKEVGGTNLVEDEYTSEQHCFDWIVENVKRELKEADNDGIS